MRETMDSLPVEYLSPMAAHVEEVLALFAYEMTPAIDAIDAAVDGHGGLFDPRTADSEKRAAIDEVLAAGLPACHQSRAKADASDIVLYVDGSSRGNPGPAGAGAVLRTGEDDIVRLGRPVGSRTGNNIAEYAALHLGLEALETWCHPGSVEIRIDSMTVINAIWGENQSTSPPTQYSTPIEEHLSRHPDHSWTHLADSDPNPADARATVGADIAALGPN